MEWKIVFINSFFDEGGVNFFVSVNVIVLFSILEIHGGPIDVFMLRHTFLSWISQTLREVTPCLHSKV